MLWKMGFSAAKIAPSPPYTPPGTIEARKGFAPLFGFSAVWGCERTFAVLSQPLLIGLRLAGKVEFAIAGIVARHAAGRGRMQPAVAAEMAPDSAGRGEVILPIAIIVVGIGAQRAHMIARRAEVVLAAGGQPVARAAAQISSAHRA